MRTHVSHVLLELFVVPARDCIHVISSGCSLARIRCVIAAHLRNSSVASNAWTRCVSFSAGVSPGIAFFSGFMAAVSEIATREKSWSREVLLSMRWPASGHGLSASSPFAHVSCEQK